MPLEFGERHGRAVIEDGEVLLLQILHGPAFSVANIDLDKLQLDGDFVLKRFGKSNGRFLGRPAGRGGGGKDREGGQGR
jgi:hypothetical protein